MPIRPIKSLTQISLVVSISLAAAQSASAFPIEEPVPASAIKVTVSSTFSPQQDGRHLVDGSGLSGDRHDNHPGANTMWHTVENPANTWVRFDFTQPVSIAAVRIWNHNQSGLTDRGFRKARLVANTGVTRTIELKRGTGAAETIPLNTTASSIILAADSNYGGNYYGLSEVQFITRREVAEKDLPFPTGMDCKPQPFYGHRRDGKPGRAVKLVLTGGKLYGDVSVETMGETTRFSNLQGASELMLLLPAGASVTNACEARVTLQRGERSLQQTVNVPAKRQWTVYIYPHSHVDIGYTNTQKNV